MGSKEQLQQQLRENMGCDEIPIIKSVNISSLTYDQLQAIMLENNLTVNENREYMENILIATLGSYEVDIFEMVRIDSLNVVELEELLSNISISSLPLPRPPEKNNNFNDKPHDLAANRTPPEENNFPANRIPAEEEIDNAINAPEFPEQINNYNDEANNLPANRASAREEINEEINAREVPAIENGNMVSRKTIREAQQELAQNCGFGDEIIWDLLPSSDADVMEKKIKQLIPDQEKGQNAIENLRKNIFENVWAQRKYTNRTSVTYLFYVMVTKNEDFNTALDSTEFSCHPVFRCRKCENNSDSRKCCMIYVDETGRVYQNWKSFVEENLLPPGTMVAPRKGVYNFNNNNEVILDIYCTPSATTGAKAMSIAQTGSAVVGIGAACVPIAALALPVAAPVMAGAALIGLGVGAFSSVTSALNLRDRKKHEQSISITDREARGSYLGMIGGAVGMVAAGATSAMTSMAAAGKATAGIEVLVNGINITSIVLSGSGVANGVLDLLLKYNDGDKITSLDVLQLSASLVLFTHSVYNFQLASQIANDARVNSIKAYRDTLSNRQRRMFDKMSKETIRIRGSTQGKMDIIRGVNEIPDRQYLNDLFKINKQLNKRSVRPAFGESGKGVVLNNELPVETGVLRQSVQHQKGPNILDKVSRPIPSTHNSDTYTTQTPKAARLLYSTGKIEQNIDINQDPLNVKEGPRNAINVLDNLALELPNCVIILLQEFGQIFVKNIADGYKFQDVILSMAENFPEKTFRYLMNLAQDFIENYLNELHRILKLYIPTESVLYRILKHVLDNYYNFDYDFISQKKQEIIQAIKKYYLTLNPNNNPSLTKKCPDCDGWFYICNL